MPRPKKTEAATTDTLPDKLQEIALPPRSQLPALLAQAKRDGDEALIARILAACGE